MQVRSIKKISRFLLELHGLHDWDIIINNSNDIGKCDENKKAIYFSRQYINEDNAEIIDTILHEIAHALVGVEHVHNEIWEDMAHHIGCNGKLSL